jgi:hypothetical protein
MAAHDFSDDALMDGDIADLAEIIGAFSDEQNRIVRGKPWR